MALPNWRRIILLNCLTLFCFSKIVLTTKEIVQINSAANNELVINSNGGNSDSWQLPQFSEFSSGKDGKFIQVYF